MLNSSKANTAYVNNKIEYLSGLHTSGDYRNDNTLPDDYANRLVFVGLKFNSKIGLSLSGVGSYSYLIGLRGWSDNSGGQTH